MHICYMHVFSPSVAGFPWGGCTCIALKPGLQAAAALLPSTNTPSLTSKQPKGRAEAGSMKRLIVSPQQCPQAEGMMERGSSAGGALRVQNRGFSSVLHNSAPGGSPETPQARL